MPGIIRSTPLALVMGLVLATTACQRKTSPADVHGKSSPPTRSPGINATDIEVARHAMNLQDVLAMLKKGHSEQTVIREVRRRHITQKIAKAKELELSLMGAGHRLLAELRDDKNVLTESQELAYGQLHGASHSVR